MYFILLLFLVVASANARVVFDDGFVVGNSDFTGTPPRFNLTVVNGVGHLVYAASAGDEDFNNKVNIVTETEDGSQTNVQTLQVLAIPNPLGMLPAWEIPVNHTSITITINSEEPPPAIVFYFVKLQGKQLGGTAPPVFDAFHATRNVSSDNSYLRPAATFLSAGGRFTLSDFDIGEAAGVKVFTVGWESVIIEDTKFVEPVLNIGSSDVAKKSFVTIFGPIATVLLTNPGAGKFSVTTKPKKAARDFEPSASFAAVSPGFISSGRKEQYDSFDNGHIQHDFFSTTDAANATITTKIREMPGSLYLKAFISGAQAWAETYTGDLPIEPVTTNLQELKVNYEWTPPHDEVVVFLVQVTTEALPTPQTTPSTLSSLPTDPATTQTSPETTTSSGFKPAIPTTFIVLFMLKMFM